MLLHKTVQTSNGKATRSVAFTPSRGPVGSFVNILGRLYLRGERNRGFIKLPKGMSDYAIRQLEHRNKTVARVRYALAVGAGLIIGTLVHFALRHAR